MINQNASHVVVTLLAVAIALTSHLHAAETITDDAHGFTLTLPDGFVANPDLVGAAPRILHGFILGDPADDELDILLLIEKMRGLIGRERLTPEQMPPSFQGRLFTAQWQGFEVDAFMVPEEIGEVQFITYNVQLPTKPAAIQVKLFGPADREAELKSLLAEILKGLKGESNWIRSAAPFAAVTSSPYYGAILLTLAMVFILCGLIALWRISREAQRGTVLAIAVVIYLAGAAFTGVRIREVLMLTGALKMLGFAGGILGIFDLVRKRKPKDDSAK